MPSNNSKSKNKINNRRLPSQHTINKPGTPTKILTHTTIQIISSLGALVHIKEASDNSSRHIINNQTNRTPMQAITRTRTNRTVIITIHKIRGGTRVIMTTPREEEEEEPTITSKLTINRTTNSTSSTIIRGFKTVQITHHNNSSSTPTATFKDMAVKISNKFINMSKIKILSQTPPTKWGEEISEQNKRRHPIIRREEGTLVAQIRKQNKAPKKFRPLFGLHLLIPPKSPNSNKRTSRG